MSGVDRITGKPLSGWPHVAQSISVLLTTPKTSRVFRRQLGADLPRLVDAPISAATVVNFYSAVATAIRDQEPRFSVTRMTIEDATPGGVSLLAEGIYYPRGHLGDFTVSEPASVSVPL